MSILDSFFSFLTYIESILWGHLGFTAVLLAGLYLTFKSKFYQFRILCSPKKVFSELKNSDRSIDRGIHPFKLYFASLGGMIGLGNIVGVTIAVVIGGPGALFWLWVTSIFGMVIKYAEIYLGIKYRVPHAKSGFDGGPMYYLEAAFGGNKIASYLVCVFLCIYGTEVFQFTVLSDTISKTLSLDKNIIVFVLLFIVIFSAIGGVVRLSNICAAVLPVFMLAYIGMCIWIIAQNYPNLFTVFPEILHGAFNGHAAIGGFAGSSMIIAAQQGISRAVYSGDIATGYDSIILSETTVLQPEKQARIAIFSLLIDGFICTLSCLLLLTTGMWKINTTMQVSEYIPTILGKYFPFAEIFSSSLITIVAYVTITGYLVVGLKCAKYLSKKYGEKLYLTYSIIAFILCSFYDQTSVMLIMSISGGMLLLFNLIGIIKLRNEIKFK
jgi:AGCS family alanine or glycine:cation symporter